MDLSDGHFEAHAAQTLARLRTPLAAPRRVHNHTPRRRRPSPSPSPSPLHPRRADASAAAPPRRAGADGSADSSDRSTFGQSHPSQDSARRRGAHGAGELSGAMLRAHQRALELLNAVTPKPRRAVSRE